MVHTMDGRERLAKLEQRMDDQEEKIAKIASTLETIQREVSTIRLRLEKSMSFVGGIAFTFSMVGGAFAVGVHWILNKMGVVGG